MCSEAFFFQISLSFRPRKNDPRGIFLRFHFLMITDPMVYVIINRVISPTELWEFQMLGQRLGKENTRKNSSSFIVLPEPTICSKNRWIDGLYYDALQNTFWAFILSSNLQYWRSKGMIQVSQYNLHIEILYNIKFYYFLNFLSIFSDFLKMILFMCHFHYFII
jgi:hypothetical protein